MNILSSISPCRWSIAALLALLTGLSSPCLAHQWSEASIRLALAQNQLRGQWTVALRDLEDTLGLDANGDREITWGEVRRQRERIITLAAEHLRLRADGRDVPFAVGEMRIDDHDHANEANLLPDDFPSDGAHLVLAFSAELPGDTRRFTVDYDFLFELDPEHRGRLQWRMGGQTLAAVLQPDQTRWEVVLPRSWFRGLLPNTWSEHPPAWHQVAVWGGLPLLVGLAWWIRQRRHPRA